MRLKPFYFHSLLAVFIVLFLFAAPMNSLCRKSPANLKRKVTRKFIKYLEHGY